MRHSTFQSVLEARDRDEFRDIIVRFAKRIGFDWVAGVVVVEHRDAQAEFFAVENAPEPYHNAMRDPQNGRVDPVMQHCKHRSTPILWTQDTYLKAGRIDKWEEQAQFGFCTGICLALHMPEGRHFVLGVDRDQRLPDDRAEVTRMVAELQLFAVYAEDAAMRVLCPRRRDPEPPRLTGHEIDTLRWTMEGKTVWEASVILKLAESIVQLHIDNAVRKLACANVHQAVLKALRLGLIR
ncbi:MAG TPA: LuxR family transcriptional regulator [Hyphomicrobium sp.]|nr:LuxR family transcriptional regulator [Hyphomicrobium sp.]